jgi:hypothetical protein
MSKMAVPRHGKTAPAHGVCLLLTYTRSVTRQKIFEKIAIAANIFLGNGLRIA